MKQSNLLHEYDPKTESLKLMWILQDDEEIFYQEQMTISKTKLLEWTNMRCR